MAGMAWIAEDRRAQQPGEGQKPYLTQEMRQHLAQVYLPRYPSKRAALLPALHYLQHAYGYLPMAAIGEIAAFLETSASEALDTASFYEEYWLKPKGEYLLQVCRSLACEICGSKSLTSQIRAKLNIEPGQTTADGRFTLIELECLGSCGTAPVLMVNEVLYENVTPEALEQILNSLPAHAHDFKDPTITWQEMPQGH